MAKTKVENKAAVEILAVDDSPTQLQLLSHHLEEAGYVVRTARNGREALEAAERGNVNLVITDINMPEMDGYELCRRIRRHPRFSQVPVMLLTTLSGTADVMNALEVGADAFMVKPVDGEFVLSTVASALENARMRGDEDEVAGLEVIFENKKLAVSTDRRRAVNLLLSSYETAVRQKQDIDAAQLALAAAVSKLDEGDLTARVPEPEFKGELLRLARSFNVMAVKLEKRDKEVRDAEARLQTVFDNLTEGVAVSDIEGRLLQFNPAAVRIHGFSSPEEYMRFLPEFEDTFELSGPEGAVWPIGDWPLSRILRGENLRDLEVNVQHRHNGWQRVFSYGGALVRDTEGRPLMVIVTMRDVTERKRAEARIWGQLEHLNLLDRITRATGERQDLQSIFQVVVKSLEDSLPVDFGCVLLHDPVAKVLRVTAVGDKSAGLANELIMDTGSVIGVDANGLARCMQGELVYEPDIGQVAFPFPRRLARAGLRSLVLAPLRSESRIFGALVVARKEANAFESTECEFLRQLSEHVALAAQQAQLYGSLQQAYDELRQTQEAAMQQERLRALGQMASGVAHDINNALSPVSLYTESLLETEKALSERGRGQLETIQRAVDDVAKTLARMREFYREREQQAELAPVETNQVVQQVLDLTKVRWSGMAQQHGVTIRAQTELAANLPRIMGVESELREALTNLVFNAVDAMPEGGTLTLRTRLADDARVVIEVADEGTGMDEETRRRCLEPFFTTKGERGTGLGLAMVFGMLRRHGAQIEIDSAPDAGTKMRMMFAASVTAAPLAGAIAEAPAVRKHLRLLIVDDDPIVLRALRHALEIDAHRVSAADGGQTGIDAFREALARGEAFDAVFTDLGMPNVDGRKVAAAVKEASPSTPVILLTGWGERIVAEGDIPAHVDQVLAKPAKLREVRTALARLFMHRPKED